MTAGLAIWFEEETSLRGQPLERCEVHFEFPYISSKPPTELVLVFLQPLVYIPPIYARAASCMCQITGFCLRKEGGKGQDIIGHDPSLRFSATVPEADAKLMRLHLLGIPIASRSVS